MNKWVKRIIFLLIFTLLSPVIFYLVPVTDSLTKNEVLAAEKRAELNSKEFTVGINSSPEFISIKNRNPSATYTYQPKDTGVVTINKYQDIIGVSLGKTSIKVIENLNGVDTELGTVSVKVVPCELPCKEINVGVNSKTFISLSYMNHKPEIFMVIKTNKFYHQKLHSTVL